MADRKKIALCLEFPIEQFGGTEILVRQLIYGLAPRYALTLVSGDDELSLKKSTVADKIERHLPWKSSEITRANSERLAQSLFDDGIQLAHFHFGGNYGWGNRFFNRCPALFLDRLGIPCLSTNHGAFSIFDGYCGPQRSALVKGGYFLPAWFSKLRVLSRLKAEIAVSQHDYRALCRWYFPLRSKFGQIYHSQLHRPGPDEPAPTPAAARTKAIICVGTFGLRKGQNLLAAAFGQIAAEFPDWKLVLIGRHGHDGVLAEVKDVIAKNNLADKILLLDKCSHEEVGHWMRTAAIFAMPSLYEGLGLSLQEALYLGCACIGSSAGGITDLIQNDSNGILVPRGSVDELARGLRKLMADEKLRDRFGAQGRQSIIQKEMFAEFMVEKYDRLYQRILSGSAT